MIDRREAILARLVAVLSDIPGVPFSNRNPGTISGIKRPAIVLYDGSENVSDQDSRPPRTTSDLVVMSPVINVLMAGRRYELGSLINNLRRLIIPAVLTDSELIDLTKSGAGPQGFIRYMGCGLDTQTGETGEGTLELHFDFQYVLACSELAD